MLMANIADGQVQMSKIIRRHLSIYDEKLNSIEASMDKLDKKSSLPLMRFGKNHIDEIFVIIDEFLKCLVVVGI